LVSKFAFKWVNLLRRYGVAARGFDHLVSGEAQVMGFEMAGGCTR
jgi:hypothetical protein